MTDEAPVRALVPESAGPVLVCHCSHDHRCHDANGCLLFACRKLNCSTVAR